MHAWERTGIAWAAWFIALGTVGGEIGVLLWAIGAAGAGIAAGVRWVFRQARGRDVDQRFREIVAGWDA